MDGGVERRSLPEGSGPVEFWWILGIVFPAPSEGDDDPEGFGPYWDPSG